MTARDLLDRLGMVRARGAGQWSARCPAHDDRTPSLSIREGEDGRILLHDFGGCRVEDICAALGLRLTDLFPEREPDPHRWQEQKRQRERERAWREQERRARGKRIDARREAERVVRAARGITIDGLFDAELDRMVNTLAEAYAMLDDEADDELARIL